MSYSDTFRVSVHGVITNNKRQVLQLKTTYNGNRWGLPGGSIEAGETIYEALERECREELGKKVKILYLSGIYYHTRHNSYAMIFRCEMPGGTEIKLSSEHSDYKFFNLKDLEPVQKKRVGDCLKFNGKVVSRVL